jgi:hypothetical protein
LPGVEPQTGPVQRRKGADTAPQNGYGTGPSSRRSLALAALRPAQLFVDLLAENPAIEALGAELPGGQFLEAAATAGTAKSEHRVRHRS